VNPLLKAASSYQYDEKYAEKDCGPRAANEPIRISDIRGAKIPPEEEKKHESGENAPVTREVPEQVQANRNFIAEEVVGKRKDTRSDDTGESQGLNCEAYLPSDREYVQRGRRSYNLYSEHEIKTSSVHSVSVGGQLIYVEGTSPLLI